MDVAALTKYLSTLGYEPTRHDGATLRVLGRLGDDIYPVFLRLDPHWLVLSVVPFLPTQGQNSFELARWLLRQNRDMAVSRFAYDDEGDVVLTADLPTESLDLREIEAALRELLERAHLHRATLRTAAQRANGE